MKFTVFTFGFVQLFLHFSSCKTVEDTDTSHHIADAGADMNTDGTTDPDTEVSLVKPYGIPPETFGVWARSGAQFDSSDPDYDYLRGLEVTLKWEEIQPNNSASFEWSNFESALNEAYDRGQWVYASIVVGDSTPKWVYQNGVPKVETDHNNRSIFPYYLHPDYIHLYYNLIHQFGIFLRSQPAQLLRSIAFVQVKTGATGDESPYKGELTQTSQEFAISDSDWLIFRLAAFEQFRLEFLDGDQDTVIPLLFNNIHPDDYPQEWSWVINNIRSGFGFKASGYIRGHHLTQELLFCETWRPFSVNPQELALFSRAEMDQTWKNPLYQLNESLGMYWGAINGLNAGLSIWDISKSALEHVKENPKFIEAFRFFERYANQVYPESATRAFIALHMGLDASDTNKFPETQKWGGAASKGNTDRCQAICNAYSKQGARMDHLEAATWGQVKQRSSQQGYNDCGWQIWSGNYSRFIRQIDPDSTSIGLFRVGVPYHTIKPDSPIYSRFARKFVNIGTNNTMYFDCHDDLFRDRAEQVQISVTYLDNTAGSTWELRYHGENGLATAFIVTNTGSGEWKSKSVILKDAVLQNGLDRGADFVLVNTDGLNDIFHLIEIQRSARN